MHDCYFPLAPFCIIIIFRLSLLSFDNLNETHIFIQVTHYTSIIRHTSKYISSEFHTHLFCTAAIRLLTFSEETSRKQKERKKEYLNVFTHRHEMRLQVNNFAIEDEATKQKKTLQNTKKNESFCVR